MNLEFEERLVNLRKECVEEIKKHIREKGVFYENSGNYMLSTYLPNFNTAILISDAENGIVRDFVFNVVMDKYNFVKVETNDELIDICFLSTDDIIRLQLFLDALTKQKIEEMKVFAEHCHDIVG